MRSAQGARTNCPGRLGRAPCVLPGIEKGVLFRMLEAIVRSLDVGILVVGVISVIYLRAFDSPLEGPVGKEGAEDEFDEAVRRAKAGKEA